MPFFDRQAENHTSADTDNAKLDAGLRKSRGVMRGLGRLLHSKAGLDDGLFDELLDLLLTADVGVTASQDIVERSRKQARNEKLTSADQLLTVVRQQMLDVLAPCAEPPQKVAQPYVIMVVGVNGVGKTTTVAKIAQSLQGQGNKVVLAAADTFRAAAVEQLQHWGERLNITVVAQGSGADAAAVAHDALASARASQADYVLVDTAGRQHTQQDLMAQLGKIKRVLGKLDPQAPHEVMQVLDAGTGQNALSQFKYFDEAVGVDSLTITKLDGTAKGGVLLALAADTARPVRFVGVGEGADDLRPFDPAAFVDALLPDSLAE